MKTKTAKRGRPSKKQLAKRPSSVKEISSNPFEIRNDIPAGRVVGNDDPKIDMLIEQVYKLKAGDRMQSVNVPATLYPTRNDAYNLLRIAKYKIKKNNMAEIVLSIKTIISSDSKKSYLGSRIYRIK